MNTTSAAVSRYNFYGFLGLEIVSRRECYHRYFDNEYGYLKQGTASDSRSRVRVFVDLGLPEFNPATDIRRSTRFKRLFRVSYLVRRIDSRDVEIYFTGSLVDKFYLKAIAVFLQCELVEPVMYLKLLEDEVLLMHAAGVSVGPRAHLFPAGGGTGKTTLCMKLCLNGCGFLGDDLLLVSCAEGKVYPYPRPLHLFSYNLDILPASLAAFKVRVKVRVKDLIRKVLNLLTGQTFLISTRVQVGEVFPQIRLGVPSDFGSLSYLEKSGEHRVLESNDAAARSELVQCLLDSFDLRDYLRNNLYCDGSREYFDRMAQAERDLVERVLGHFTPVSRINVRNTSVDKLYGTLT